MKNSILKLFVFAIFVFLTNLGVFAQATSDPLVKEKNQYLKNVNLDGGKILNKDLLNDFLSLSVKDNWNNQIKFWVSSQWGVKEYKGRVMKQYELNSNDLTTLVPERRPVKIEKNGVYGIQYNGEDNYNDNADVKAEQPLSLLLVFEPLDSKDVNVLFDTKDKRNCQISIQPVGNEQYDLLIKSAGDVTVNGLKSGINFVYIEFNLLNSKVYINGKLAKETPIGKTDINGLTLGEGMVNNKVKNFKGNIYEVGIISNFLNDSAREDLFKYIDNIYFK